MVNSEKNIAAIDIGTTKIATVVADRKDGKFVIKGFGAAPSNGIKHGVVRNIDETVNAITASLNNLGNANDATFNEVYVGIAGQYVRTFDNTCRITINGKVTERHLVELKDIALNIVSPGNETLDAILMSYSINGKEVANPIGEQCDYLYGNFHVITGQTMMVNNIKKCVTLAGLDVRSIFLEPLASAEAVLTEEEKNKGVALIDIGGGTTDLAVYKDGEVIHTAVIPIGGATVTGDVQERFHITYEQAETLKCMYGSAVHVSGKDTNIEVRTAQVNTNLYVSRNEMSEVIQARMEEILNAVKFQIETVFPDVIPAGVVITGGGALVSNLNQLASFIMKSNIRLAYPVANIEGERAELLKKPQYSTVVGLIKKGYDYEQGILKKEFISVEPEPVVEKKSEAVPVVEQTPEPKPEPKPESKLEPKPEPKKDKNKGGFKSMLNSIMKKLDEDE